MTTKNWQTFCGVYTFLCNYLSDKMQRRTKKNQSFERWAVIHSTLKLNYNIIIHIFLGLHVA